jgi:hypothetical protein
MTKTGKATSQIRWSQLIKPGMVINLGGQQIPVEWVAESYNTVIYTSNGRTYTVAYGTQVEILGYFNP